MTTPPLRDTIDALDALIGIAPGHRQWSTTDAGDIPALLTRIDELEADNARLRDAITAYLEGDGDGEERLRAAREGKDTP